MFAAQGESPSRCELLSMVKKHSNLLGKTIVDEQDASDIEMDQGFWHDILNLYFVQATESRGRQDDDLIFFVRKMVYGSNEESDDDPPYFVRRWAPKLDNMVGDKLMEVDWRRSFYLNLIAHTSFTVTVAICSNQDLKNHRPGEDTHLTPIYKVVKTVYASPSRVNFHVDARKEAETVPAYPDICFTIDDFDSTFDTVVLSDTDHCYCVILNAHDGAAFPDEKSELDSSDGNSRQTERDSGKKSKAKVTIFSGFVSYQMVREAYDGNFPALWDPRQLVVNVDMVMVRILCHCLIIEATPPPSESSRYVRLGTQGVNGHNLCPLSGRRGSLEKNAL